MFAGIVVVRRVVRSALTQSVRPIAGDRGTTGAVSGNDTMDRMEQSSMSAAITASFFSDLRR